MVFAWATWHGAGQPDCDGAQASTASCQPGAGTRALGNLLAPLSAGVKLPQKSYSVAPNASVDVEIPVASADMRSLKITLAEGNGARLRLVNVKPDPNSLADQRDLDKGRLPSDAADASSRMTRTYVVTAQGATLTMQCLGSVRCVFQGS